MVRKLIDTHCHLTDPRLLEQLPDVLNRAAEAGVTRMVTIGTDIHDARAAIELSRQHANVRCVVGIHPNYVAEAEESDLPLLRGLQQAPLVVALGEMGLDYHYDTPRDRQRAFFEYQLNLAKELNRPVVIHCREAIDDTLALMKHFASVPAVFHCFTGTLDEARRIIGAGYLIGFTGPITYKKNDDLREVVRFVPIDRLVVETDAPYLSPEPMRKQKINEPALVMHTAEMVAKVKGLTLEDVDVVTTRNALKFYRWA